MKRRGIQNVLVIGLDAVAQATSAKNTGYNVYAVDHFGDQDLKRVCKDSISIITQEPGKSCGRLETDYSPHTLLSLAKRLLKKHQIDAALLTSGLEDSPQVLAELNELVPIVGNSPEAIAGVRNRIGFFRQLKKLAIPHPQTMLARNIVEGKRMAKDIGYPAVVKPLSSLGGYGIRKTESEQELDKIFPQIISSSPHGVLIQEFVLGTSASMSFLSSKKATLVLTFNEQLLGIQELGQSEPFGYCGNVVPCALSSELVEKCGDMAQKIVSRFNLVGSNGIDLVVSGDGTPYVVEVNPRLQGSLECVERVLRINLVDAHVKACLEGTLPFLERKTRTYCVRLILYARQRSLATDLSNIEEVRDIPLLGAVVEEGEPLCSVMSEGKTRGSALGKAMSLAHRIYAVTMPGLH